MMMPANFTAVNSEVVYGGADLFSVLADTTAPVWNAANVKQFNTNIVTLVGNTFLSKVVNQTVGVLFSGNTTWKEVGNIGKTLFTTNVAGGTIDKNNFGDYVMNALGVAAAVYNLGVAPTKNTVKETDVKFTV